MSSFSLGSVYDAIWSDFPASKSEVSDEIYKQIPIARIHVFEWLL